jgi:hypothetical protein
MLIRCLWLVAGLCVAQSAAAVCYYDGRPYPTGAQVNGYTCQPDGTWKKGGRYPALDASPLTQSDVVFSEMARPVASPAGKCAAYEYFSCRSDLAQTSL